MDEATNIADAAAEAVQPAPRPISRAEQFATVAGQVREKADLSDSKKQAIILQMIGEEMSRQTEVLGAILHNLGMLCHRLDQQMTERPGSAAGLYVPGYIAEKDGS